MYGGGLDTVRVTSRIIDQLPTILLKIVAATSVFFLAMTLFPEIQRKAQDEIDKVIGPHRLPSLKDREQLPYIGALVKEVHRWRRIGPMGNDYSCNILMFY